MINQKSTDRTETWVDTTNPAQLSYNGGKDGNEDVMNSLLPRQINFSDDDDINIGEVSFYEIERKLWGRTGKI